MLAAPTGQRARAWIAAAVAVLSLGMIAPSLALPQNPWHSPWRTWPAVTATIDWSHPTARWRSSCAKARPAS